MPYESEHFEIRVKPFQGSEDTAGARLTR